MDREPVIVAAARTPHGRRNGALSKLPAPRLLAAVQHEVVQRSGLESADVDQLIGGCVTQAGMQAINVTRMAWLSLGNDYTAAATTIDCQCGSGLQANNLTAGLIATGGARVAIACGIEHMSGVPLRTALEALPHGPRDDQWPWPTEAGSQFIGAERIATRRQLTRNDLDEFGLLSQNRAAAAWDGNRYEREIVAVEITDDGTTRRVDRDECLRATSLDALGSLRPVLEDGLHTAGTSSPIADGAAAVMWIDRKVAEERGLRPRARIAYHTMVGTDPYYYLDGPVDATTKMLDESPFTIKDFDVIECNEAFAAVTLSFQRTFDVPWDRLNPNGGAIALGHPVGATGARLVVSALHELERIDGHLAYLTMCQGGSLGIATVIERLT